MSICPSVCWSAFLSIYVSLCPALYLHVCLCLSFYLSVGRLVGLLVSRSVRQSDMFAAISLVTMSGYLSVSHAIMIVCLSVHLTLKNIKIALKLHQILNSIKLNHTWLTISHMGLLVHHNMYLHGVWNLLLFLEQICKCPLVARCGERNSHRNSTNKAIYERMLPCPALG